MIKQKNPNPSSSPQEYYFSKTLSRKKDQSSLSMGNISLFLMQNATLSQVKDSSKLICWKDWFKTKKKKRISRELKVETTPSKGTTQSCSRNLSYKFYNVEKT